MPATVGEVLLTDGEGAVLEDIHELQRMLRFQIAHLWGVHGRLNEQSRGPYATDVVFSHAVGGAMYGAASARVATNREGWIAIATSTTAPDGSEPTLLYYYLHDDEISKTLDIGDADPRIDLIVVKLEYADTDSESRHFESAGTRLLSSSSTPKRRKVSLTSQVVKGTPGPTPSQPPVPVGFVKLAAVYVPASHNAVIDQANVMDYRMPIGLKVIDVPGGHWLRSGATTEWFSLAGVIGSSSSTTAGTGAYALCGSSNWTGGRVVRVGFAGQRDSGSSGGLELLRVDQFGQNSGNAFEFYAEDVPSADYADVSALEPLAGSGDFEYHELSLLTGEPVWANGYRAGYAAGRLFTPPFTPGSVPYRIPRLALKYLADGTSADILSLARFYVAGGL